MTTSLQLHGWAESTPWNCLIRDTGCVSATHNHTPMVSDPCAAPECPHILAVGERVFRVTDPTIDGYVCHRHIDPVE